MYQTAPFDPTGMTPQAPVPTVQPFFNALQALPGHQFLAAAQGRKPPLVPPKPTPPPLPPMVQAMVPAADATVTMKKAMDDAQAQQQQSAAALAQYTPDLGPTPQYNAPQMQAPNKGADLGAVLGALLMPKAGAFFGKQLLTDQTNREAQYKRDQEAAAARYDAESAAATRAERLAEFHERQMLAKANFDQTQSEKARKDYLQSVKDMGAHQVAAERVSEYARNITLNANAKSASLNERVTNDLRNYNVKNAAVGQRLEIVKIQQAGAWQRAGLHAQTALQLGDQRQSTNLLLEQMRENEQTLKQVRGFQFNASRAALTALSGKYDKIVAAAGMPGADEAVKAQAAELLKPGGEYEKLVNQLRASSGGILSAPPLTSSTQAQAAATEGLTQGYRAMGGVSENADPATLANLLAQNAANPGTGTTVGPGITPEMLKMAMEAVAYEHQQPQGPSNYAPGPGYAATPGAGGAFPRGPDGAPAFPGATPGGPATPPQHPSSAAHPTAPPHAAPAGAVAAEVQQAHEVIKQGHNAPDVIQKVVHIFMERHKVTEEQAYQALQIPKPDTGHQGRQNDHDAGVRARAQQLRAMNPAMSEQDATALAHRIDAEQNRHPAQHAQQAPPQAAGATGGLAPAQFIAQTTEALTRRGEPPEQVLKELLRALEAPPYNMKPDAAARLVQQQGARGSQTAARPQ